LAARGACLREGSVEATDEEAEAARDEEAPAPPDAEPPEPPDEEAPAPPAREVLGCGGAIGRPACVLVSGGTFAVWYKHARCIVH
jgi:hypothetical protein